MSSFEFVFSLLGLMLGFSLAELLGGLLRVLKAHGQVRLGWLTPMLALFVMLDLTSFWANAWDARDIIPASYGLLVLGLFASGIYFLAASLVFPEQPDALATLDDHFYRRRRPILAGIGLCNGLVILALVAAGSAQVLNRPALITHSIYYTLLLLAALPRIIWLNLAALAGLIALYGYFAVMTLMYVRAAA